MSDWVWALLLAPFAMAGIVFICGILYLSALGWVMIFEKLMK